MRRISSVLLFSFVGVLSLAGQNLIKPKQIAPDTLNRIIIMTDTITEVDTVFREFKYYSIDSLVRQIVNDSLGIDSLWKKDGTYSLVQNYSPNNNFLFGTNVGEGLTGIYNTMFSNTLPVGSSYSFSSGFQNYAAATDVDFSFVFGQQNNLLGASNVDYTFLGGYRNAFSATTLTYDFINGQQNFYTSTGSIASTFMNGYQNAYSTTAATTYVFINGQQNAFNNTTTLSSSLINGFQNAYSTAGINSMAIIGHANLRNSTSDAIYGASFGWQNSYNAIRYRWSFTNGFNNNYTGTGNTYYSFLSGDSNAYTASSLNHVTAIGLSNLRLSTSALSNVIAIGQENGYNLADQSNSIYLGYRQGYTTGATNRLMIGMAQDDPLLSGHFTSDWIRVNGYFEVRDKTGTAGNIAAWDGDKLVDSGTSLASIGGDPDQTLSYNGATSDLTISGTGGNTIALPEMVAYPIGSTGYGYRPEISAALAGGEPLLITEGSGINIVDNGVGTGFSISATDASTTNELQTISKSGELVTLSDGGGSFSTHTIDLGTQIAIVQPGGSTSDVVVGDIDITVPGTSATSVIGRDINGVITGVTLGSGLSLSSGTLSSTATSLWDTDGLNVYRSTGRVGVGGVEHPTYTFTANSGTIHTSGAIRGDDFYMTGGLFDAGASDGASGDILTSTGTAVDWVTPAINLDPGIGGLLSGSGTFTSSTPTKINFTSSLSDGITASTVNEDLTMPSTGYYRITANGIIAVEDDAVFNVYIYVNGSVARSYSLTQTAGNDARVISFNFIQSLTSGWAVDVRVAKTSGSSNVQASSWDLMAEFIKT